MKNIKRSILSSILFALLFGLTFNIYAKQPELEELQEEKTETKKEVKKEEPKQEQKKEEEKKVEEKKKVESEDLAPIEEKKVEVAFVKSNVAGIPDNIPINMDDVRPLFKEKWEFVFNASFETVYTSILKTIDEFGCMVASKNTPTVDDQGLQKANIKSDDCVFSVGEDSSFKVIRKYALADDKVIEKDNQKIVLGKGMPNVRGGKWMNGRLKYNFRILEQKDGRTQVTLKSEMSAFEDFVVHEVLFFSSNGVLESRMLNMLFEHLREAKTE